MLKPESEDKRPTHLRIFGVLGQRNQSTLPRALPCSATVVNPSSSAADTAGDATLTVLAKQRFGDGENFVANMEEINIHEGLTKFRGSVCGKQK